MRRARRAVVERKDGSVWRKATVYFVPNDYQRLEDFCRTTDLDISDVVAKATAEYLDRMERASSQPPTVRNPRTTDGLRSPRKADVPDSTVLRNTGPRSKRSRSSVPPRSRPST
jgi:hypothetical protein